MHHCRQSVIATCRINDVTLSLEAERRDTAEWSGVAGNEVELLETVCKYGHGELSERDIRKRREQEYHRGGQFSAA
jgi:hypothetical protein